MREAVALRETVAQRATEQRELIRQTSAASSKQGILAGKEQVVSSATEREREQIERLRAIRDRLRAEVAATERRLARAPASESLAPVLDRATARQAFLAHEIFDKPLALRGRGGWRPR